MNVVCLTGIVREIQFDVVTQQMTAVVECRRYDADQRKAIYDQIPVFWRSKSVDASSPGTPSDGDTVEVTGQLAQVNGSLAILASRVWSIGSRSRKGRNGGGNGNGEASERLVQAEPAEVATPSVKSAGAASGKIEISFDDLPF